jgi:hypothetical protein
LTELFDELGLDAALSRSIVHHDGPEGALLRTTLAYERGDFAAAALHRDADRLARHYRSACACATRTAQALL